MKVKNGAGMRDVGPRSAPKLENKVDARCRDDRNFNFNTYRAGE